MLVARSSVDSFYSRKENGVRRALGREPGDVYGRLRAMNSAINTVLLRGFLFFKSARSPNVPKEFCKNGGGRIMSVVGWHIRYVEWWKKKLGISYHAMIWIACLEGLIIGYALCFFI